MYKILITSALLLVFGSSAFMSISGLCGVFSTNALVIICLGAGFELGKLLTVAYLHRQSKQLDRLARSFYALVVLVLCFLTSLEAAGFLSQQYAAMSQARKTLETELIAVNQEAALLRSQIAVIDQTLAGLPEGYVTRRILERKQAGYDQKQARLLELTRKQAQLEAGLVSDKTYAAPLFSLARIMGQTPDQAARFLILLLVIVLEPLSIGLAVAASSVWQKPAEKPAVKMPETRETAETAIPAKTANPDKSNSYDSQNAAPAETIKTAIPAKPENAELHEMKEKHGLTEEKIARITGRNKIETVVQWLNNEKEIPEKALRELRKWARMKNKVIPIKEAPYGI